MINATALSTALALAAAALSPPSGPWILTCDMPAPSGDHTAPGAERVFRIGPRLFQEWKPTTKQFGPNLCAAYTCARTAGRLEGTISSSTLSLTVSLDLATGRGAWRTLGASGLRTTHGTCSVEPQTAQPRPQTPPPSTARSPPS